MLRLRLPHDDRARAGETTLDADGGVLVTMLATALDDELARLCGSGLLSRWTDPWDEDVGGRTVRVAMLEGPSGELVELLQVARTQTDPGSGDA